MSEKLVYLEQLETQIAEAKEILTRLQAAADAERQRLQHEEIEHLEQHLAQAEVNFQDVKAAGEEAWLELKHQSEHLWENLRKIVQSITSKLG